MTGLRVHRIRGADLRIAGPLLTAPGLAEPAPATGARLRLSACPA